MPFRQYETVNYVASLPIDQIPINGRLYKPLPKNNFRYEGNTIDPINIDSTFFLNNMETPNDRNVVSTLDKVYFLSGSRIVSKKCNDYSVAIEWISDTEQWDSIHNIITSIAAYPCIYFITTKPEFIKFNVLTNEAIVYSAEEIFGDTTLLKNISSVRLVSMSSHELELRTPNTNTKHIQIHQSDIYLLVYDDTSKCYTPYKYFDSVKDYPHRFIDVSMPQIPIIISDTENLRISKHIRLYNGEYILCIRGNDITFQPGYTVNPSNVLNNDLYYTMNISLSTQHISYASSTTMKLSSYMYEYPYFTDKVTNANLNQHVTMNRMVTCINDTIHEIIGVGSDFTIHVNNSAGLVHDDLIIKSGWSGDIKYFASSYIMKMGDSYNVKIFLQNYGNENDITFREDVDMIKLQAIYNHKLLYGPVWCTENDTNVDYLVYVINSIDNGDTKIVKMMINFDKIDSDVVTAIMDNMYIYSCTINPDNTYSLFINPIDDENRVWTKRSSSLENIDKNLISYPFIYNEMIYYRFPNTQLLTDQLQFISVDVMTKEYTQRSVRSYIDDIVGVRFGNVDNGTVTKTGYTVKNKTVHKISINSTTQETEFTDTGVSYYDFTYIKDSSNNEFLMCGIEVDPTDTDTIPATKTFYKILPNGTLEKKTSAPQLKYSSVHVIHQLIYIFGGIDGFGNISNAIYRYDPDTDVWYLENTMPVALYDVVVCDNPLDPVSCYIIGGRQTYVPGDECGKLQQHTIEPIDNHIILFNIATATIKKTILNKIYYNNITKRKYIPVKYNGSLLLISNHSYMMESHKKDTTTPDNRSLVINFETGVVNFNYSSTGKYIFNPLAFVDNTNLLIYGSQDDLINDFILFDLKSFLSLSYIKYIKISGNIVEAIYPDTVGHIFKFNIDTGVGYNGYHYTTNVLRKVPESKCNSIGNLSIWSYKNGEYFIKNELDQSNKIIPLELDDGLHKNLMVDHNRNELVGIGRLYGSNCFKLLLSSDIRKYNTTTTIAKTPSILYRNFPMIYQFNGNIYLIGGMDNNGNILKYTTIINTKTLSVLNVPYPAHLKDAYSQYMMGYKQPKIPGLSNLLIFGCGFNEYDRILSYYTVDPTKNNILSSCTLERITVNQSPIIQVTGNKNNAKFIAIGETSNSSGFQSRISPLIQNSSKGNPMVNIEKSLIIDEVSLNNSINVGGYIVPMTFMSDRIIPSVIQPNGIVKSPTILTQFPKIPTALKICGENLRYAYILASNPDDPNNYSIITYDKVYDKFINITALGYGNSLVSINLEDSISIESNGRIFFFTTDPENALLYKIIIYDILEQRVIDPTLDGIQYYDVDGIIYPEYLAGNPDNIILSEYGEIIRY